MELKDRFIVVGTQNSEVEKISKPSLSFWKDVFYRFRKNKLALVGVVLLILLIIMAIFGPYMTGYDYASNDLVNKINPHQLTIGSEQMIWVVMCLHVLGKVHGFPYLSGLQQH